MKRKNIKLLSLTAVITALSLTLTGCFISEKNIYDIVDAVLGPTETVEDIQSHAEKPASSDGNIGTNTEDSYTLMVYICGSDLESWYGRATADINEILYGYTDSNLNIVIQTGGAAEWQNSVISADTCERYLVTETGLMRVDDSIGLKDMTNPETLSDFITYCKNNYPASKYSLIMWDHGGGALEGFGYDENYEYGIMTIPEIGKALSESGIHLDFLGFDACLMATLETCMMACDYADYLIASEEAEPSGGWYYTNWIASLCENTSIGIEQHGKILVDDFIEDAYNEFPGMYSTLGIFDKKKKKNQVIPALDSFSADNLEQLDNGRYRLISRTRSDTRSVDEDFRDHIDLYDFVVKSDIASSDALAQAIKDSIVYYSNTPNCVDTHGLSICFPYNDLSLVDDLTLIYEEMDVNSSYVEFITRFANIMAGGQISASQDGNTHNFLDFLEFWGFDWFDDDYFGTTSYDETLNDLLNEYGELPVVLEGSDYLLKLTEDQWYMVSDYAMQMFVIRDGYYIDMGLDDYADFNEQGDLIVGYDETWVALDGVVVPYFYEDYTETDDYFMTYGYVPCVYNGKDSEIVIVWDTDHPYGYVSGVRTVYEDGGVSKGVEPVKKGDTFQIYYDLYDESFEYIKSVTFEDSVFTVGDELTVSYENVREQMGDSVIYYAIEDIYQNVYFTESIWYE